MSEGKNGYKLAKTPNHLFKKLVDFKDIYERFISIQHPDLIGGGGSIKFIRFAPKLIKKKENSQKQGDEPKEGETQNEEEYVVKEIDVTKNKMSLTMREFFTMASLEHEAISSADYFALPDGTKDKNGNEVNDLFYVITKKWKNISCRHLNEQVKLNDIKDDDVIKYRDSYITRLRICYGAASALLYVHKCGLLHRDVKPDNIFMDKGLNPKLGDFGLALGVDTDEKGCPGTERYMPKGLTHWTQADDIYSLALTIMVILNMVEEKAGTQNNVEEEGTIGPVFNNLKNSAAMTPAEEEKRIKENEGRPDIDRKNEFFKKYCFSSYEYPKVKEVRKVIRNALSLNADERPTISQILDAINEEEKSYYKNSKNKDQYKDDHQLYETYTKNIDKNTNTTGISQTKLSEFKQVLLVCSEEKLSQKAFGDQLVATLKKHQKNTSAIAVRHAICATNESQKEGKKVLEEFKKEVDANEKLLSSKDPNTPKKEVLKKRKENMLYSNEFLLLDELLETPME